ncbi:hypothetical protein CYLTODRAFT_334914, partial [Cylindrobasidium torrendii FP15055 ss-10]
YRCASGCTHGVLCETCICRSHGHAPLHRIERWNGSFFAQSSLRELGLVWSLRHPGALCPSAPTGRTRRLTVADVDGYKTVQVQYCYCNGRHFNPDDKNPGYAKQLLDAGLWPVTLKSPQTVITFGVIENFIHHNDADKKSSYSFCSALSAMTDAIDPTVLPNIYRPLQRAVRIWRVLAAERRSGQHFNIDQRITTRRPGSTSTFCPACVEVGFNVSHEEVWNAPEEEQSYTNFHSTDGCFNCGRFILPREDENDEALMKGTAYMQCEEQQRTFIELAKKHDPPQPQTCSKLRALQLQSVGKFKGMAVTGVVGTICTRHGFMQDNGLVNMLAGEAFMWADLSRGGSLMHSSKSRFEYGFYDVWCQYAVNVKKRITKLKFPYADKEFFELMTERMTGGIPSMHIRGHIAKCRAVY